MEGQYQNGFDRNGTAGLSGWRQVAGGCEHGNELLESVNCGEYLTTYRRLLIHAV
jgi:hypothetical protein